MPGQPIAPESVSFFVSCPPIRGSGGSPSVARFPSPDPFPRLGQGHPESWRTVVLWFRAHEVRAAEASRDSLSRETSFAERNRRGQGEREGVRATGPLGLLPGVVVGTGRFAPPPAPRVPSDLSIRVRWRFHPPCCRGGDGTYRIGANEGGARGQRPPHAFPAPTLSVRRGWRSSANSVRLPIARHRTGSRNSRQLPIRSARFFSPPVSLHA